MKKVFTALVSMTLASIGYASNITGIAADGSEDAFKIEDVRSIKLTPQREGDTGYRTIVFGAKEVEAGDAVVRATPIMVYPNPVSEYLTILGAEEADDVTVADMQGRTVVRTKGSRVDVSGLAQGSYVLTINGKSVRFIKK